MVGKVPNLERLGNSPPISEAARTVAGAATVYEFAGGSVANFAPDAPDFDKAEELRGADLVWAQRILDERGMRSGGAV